MKDSDYLIGLDLGGTALKYGICDSGGSIIREFLTATRADDPVNQILKKIADSASEALQFAEANNIQIAAIGLGTPGCVDIPNGFLRGSTPNFKHWRDVPIKEHLENIFTVPVFADNDANAMAYGEFMFGAGKGCESVICITLGTGIGGGIIIEKKLFRGSQYAGAELGHISVSYNGKKCRCGGIGCWEMYASATAMVENYLSVNPNTSSIKPREIFSGYQNGDAVAIRVVNEEIEMVGVGLASLVNIFNPEKIIIGGGLGEAGQWFIDRIAQEVRRRAMAESVKSVEIVSAKLGNKAGWLGAAALARQYYLSL